MKTVELKSAFHWNCEDCGEDNFSLPVKAEMTDREAENCYRKFHDMDEWEELPDGWRDFELVQIPIEVSCVACGETFGTEDESRV